jgi:hypothetical protein
MLYIRNSLITGVMIAVSFTAAAQEVYKSVNEEGVVEYSDTPKQDSQEIEVNPNVVEVTPEKSVAPAPEAPPSSREEAAAPVEQSVEVNDVDRLEREEKRVGHEEVQEHRARHRR